MALSAIQLLPNEFLLQSFVQEWPLHPYGLTPSCVGRVHQAIFFALRIVERQKKHPKNEKNTILRIDWPT